MKKVILLFIVILLSLFASLIYFRHTTSRILTNSPSIQSTPVLTLTPVQTLFCSPSQLQSQIVLEAGAGNIYGTLSLKNTSSTMCQIQGDQYVTATSSAQNIQIQQFGDPGSHIISLQPGQTVYSTVHYPNGPQCNGPAVQQSISFSYSIQPMIKIIFVDKTGKNQQTIQACRAASQLTTVQVWSLSEHTNVP